VGVTRDIPSWQEHFEAGGGAFKPCFFENFFMACTAWRERQLWPSMTVEFHERAADFESPFIHIYSQTRPA
jgi:hypothetical protein